MVNPLVPHLLFFLSLALLIPTIAAIQDLTQANKWQTFVPIGFSLVAAITGIAFSIRFFIDLATS
jgi:hypothetical protein